MLWNRTPTVTSASCLAILPPALSMSILTAWRPYHWPIIFCRQRKWFSGVNPSLAATGFTNARTPGGLCNGKTTAAWLSNCEGMVGKPFFHRPYITNPVNLSSSTRPELPQQSHGTNSKTRWSNSPSRLKSPHRYHLGNRHDITLALSGFLSRAGWPQDRSVSFIEKLARAHGDNETDDRVRCVKDAYAFDHPYGFRHLAELTNKSTAKCMARWIGYHEKTPSATGPSGMSLETELDCANVFVAEHKDKIIYDALAEQFYRRQSGVYVAGEASKDASPRSNPAKACRPFFPVRASARTSLAMSISPSTSSSCTAKSFVIRQMRAEPFRTGPRLDRNCFHSSTTAMEKGVGFKDWDEDAACVRRRL